MENRRIVKLWLTGSAMSFIGGFIGGYNGSNSDLSLLLTIGGTILALIFAIMAMVRLWNTPDECHRENTNSQGITPGLTFYSWKAELLRKDIANKYIPESNLKKMYSEYLASLQDAEPEKISKSQTEIEITESKQKDSNSIEDKLIKLSQLHEKGLISTETRDEKSKAIIEQL